MRQEPEESREEGEEESRPLWRRALTSVVDVVLENPAVAGAALIALARATASWTCSGVAASNSPITWPSAGLVAR